MLEKPTLDEAALIEAIRDQYSAAIASMSFLPLGADPNTAVYRLTGDDGDLFLKLRCAFDPLSVDVPYWLSTHGAPFIIAPIQTRMGTLWGTFERFTTVLYPFVEGRDAWKTGLTAHQWRALGLALRHVHTRAIPPDVAARIRRETYDPKWRRLTRAFLERVERDSWSEPVAAAAAALLHRHSGLILDLVHRSERLARDLADRPRESVTCHADIHAGNVLLTEGGALFVVDWDDPILAPKERDLMFIGGGLFGGHRPPAEEQALFYSGYGDTQVDEVALAYYRYERIIVDIAVYCESLLDTEAGGDDRAPSLGFLASNFEPEQTIELAYASDRSGLFDPDTGHGLG